MSGRTAPCLALYQFAPGYRPPKPEERCRCCGQTFVWNGSGWARS